MAQENDKILLVDDDQDVLDIHSIILSSHSYVIETATNGERALALLLANPTSYSMVITDINMPVMGGYDLCKQIKSNPTTKDIPVMFISANTDLEEILKGYAIGGFDYITKPVQENVMVQKVNNVINGRKYLKTLSEQLRESRTITNDAINFSSELGLVIEFYKNIMHASHYEHIAEQVFAVTTTLDLPSTIQIYAPDRIYNFSSQRTITPLEQNVIELSRGKGRLYEFSTKMIVNYSNFSLLLKNMPCGQEEKMGRYRDILALVGNGLEARIEQLNNDILLQKKDEMMLSIKSSLAQIEQALQEMQKENINAIEDMNGALNEAVPALGLMEYQENLLDDITKHCLQRTHQAFFKGNTIRQALEDIQTQFSHALNRYNLR